MSSKKTKKIGRPSKTVSGDVFLRAQKLKCLRTFLKMTQQQMAERLGISSDQISKQENAAKGRELDDKNIRNIIEVFNISPELFDDNIDINTFSERIKIPKEKVYTEIPNNLPRIDYEFVGRENELEVLIENLSPASRAYVLSITGVGGVGKSSLAIEVARKCIKLCLFDAVIWSSTKKEILIGNKIREDKFVESNLDGLVSKIIEVLDPELSNNLPSTQQQIAKAKQLLSTNKALLIVDNMETVDDENVRLFIEEIPSPSKALITDRRSVQSSKAVQLLELSKQDSLEIIKKQCQFHDLQLDGKQQEYLAEMIGGIPLATKWAVGQIASQHWDINMLSTHLTDNKEKPILDFLFKNSYLKLSANSKSIISTLALLPVPVTGELLAQYNEINENDAKDSLSQLLQYALISKNEDVDPKAPASFFIPLLKHRYRLLPLTKNFLAQQNENQNNELSKKIIVYTWEQLKSMTDDFNWPSRKLIKFVGKNKELMAWTIEESYRIEEYYLTTEIMKYVGYSLGIKGKHDLRQKLGEIALDAALQINAPVEQARNLILNMGWVYFVWYEFELSEEKIAQGIEIAKAAQETLFEAIGIRTMGLIRKEQGKYEQALNYLLESTKIFEAIKQHHFLSVNYGSLASLARDSEKYDDAKDYLDKAIKIAGKLKNNEEIISIFIQKKTGLLIKKEELDEAELLNEEALKLSQKIGRPIGEAYCEHSAALIQEKRGRIRKAFEHIENAAKLFLSYGSKNDVQSDYERIKEKFDKVHS